MESISYVYITETFGGFQIKIGKWGWGTEPPQIKFMSKAAMLASVFIYWKPLDKGTLDSVTYTWASTALLDAKRYLKLSRKLTSLLEPFWSGRTPLGPPTAYLRSSPFTSIKFWYKISIRDLAEKYCPSLFQFLVRYT